MVAGVHDAQHFEDVSPVPLIGPSNPPLGSLISPRDAYGSFSRQAPIYSPTYVGRAQTEAK
jgi:hypothetical protein